jgi:hypothetical protein
MNQELYDSIYFSLTEILDSETEQDRRVLDKLVSLATAGAQQYINDLEESITYLKETIKRITDDKISLLNDLKNREHLDS